MRRIEKGNFMENNTMLKDSEWAAIDGEPYRVIKFSPLLASVQNGKVVAINMTTPYASVSLERNSRIIEGFVTSKTDFLHLWLAFRERGISADEEVIMFWSVKHYKYKFIKFFSMFFPKMWVMICPKGALEIMTNSHSHPELTGRARFLAKMPIVEFKPEIIE